MLDREACAPLVRSLRQAQGAGSLTSDDVTRAAREAGRSPRTIRRWINNGAPAYRREPFTLEQEHIDVLMSCHGNVALAHRQLKAKDPINTPSRPTLVRACQRDLKHRERQFVKGGEQARRRFSLYARHEETHRNVRWEMDSCLLQTLVTVPGEPDPVRPWLTMIIDSASRAIPGWAISIGSVDAADALATLRNAVTISPSHGPFGGAPDVLVMDNARAFLGDEMTGALAALGTHGHATDPYSPHQKGKIERVFGTIKTEHLAGLVFYGEAPRKANGKRYQPNAAPPTLAEFQKGFERYVDDYNLRRPHTALNKQTPLDRWTQDTNPLREFPCAELAMLLLHREQRKVGKDGIRLGGRTYIAPELSPHCGETVEVRYHPHTEEEVVVMQNGAFVCTAEPRDPTDREQAIRIAEARHEANKPMNTARRRVTGKQRGRLATKQEPRDPTTDMMGVLDGASARRTHTDKSVLGWLERNPPPGEGTQR